jgi:hypothetical protein
MTQAALELTAMPQLQFFKNRLTQSYDPELQRSAL